MKITTAFILSSAIICSLTAGCAGGASSSEVSDTAKTTAATAAVTSQAELSSEGSTDSSVESSSVSGNKVKSLTVCGHDMHYPMTLGELGDDFTLDLWNSAVLGDKFMCTINYKEQHIGEITLKDVDSEDKVNENAYIAGIEVSAREYDFKEVPISLNGIVLGDSRDKALKEFGESIWDYDDSDFFRVKDEALIDLIFDYSDDGKITQISIDWF